jgi:hypothetical protein
MRTVVDLLCEEDAAPRDLLSAARSPLKRMAPEPGAYERGAAAARAALGLVDGRTS